MSDRLRFGCLMGLLLFVTVDLRWMSHGKPMPPRNDFASFPAQISLWTGRDLPDMSEGEKRVLAADNYVLREYRHPVTGADLGLFIAYYKSQRSGDALHSPKNCLPGSGWEPIKSDQVRIADPYIPGGSFSANHYVIAKDGVEQEVVYWYQAGGRAFASEYAGKFYLVWDGITKGRTDGALIRITAPRSAAGDSHTLQEMLTFARDLTPVLPQFLPN
jgi:EpsI family protein